jgi:streptogramin lyase
MNRREVLAAALALNIGSMADALAQSGGATPSRSGGSRGAGGSDGGGRGATPTRVAKTTRMFKSPGLYPNALAVMTDAPGGLWIGQQKVTPQNAPTYNLPLDPDRDEMAWLVDWNGTLIKSIPTHSRNTSGMAYGDGCVWMGANADPYGIFQVDLNGRQITHRQIPLSIDGRGGGTHGVKWHDGKLWIAALRLGGILRVDPKTWAPEVLIRVSSAERPRLHDVAFDDEGNIWVVTGNESSSYSAGRAGLNKYDGRTGQLLMTVEFQPGSCDPHGLVWHDGRLVSCDAGIHPGWKGNESPHTGYIFSIEID